jgi:3-deoxy-manno-octulosonate cytidylyltransferase (CMP-KDO synthetase)
MKALAVVPARYASVRFPGKPLATIRGKPMVQWVVEAARSCEAFDAVVVATDDERIADCARGFGCEVEITSDQHRTGSDRVAEVAERRPEFDVIVNVQGDQPFASQAMLEELVRPYREGERPEMTTLACPLAEPGQRDDPNVVKVVCDRAGYALYFSRSPIPHMEEPDPAVTLHHLGLYAFTRETVLRFPSLEPTPLEQLERLEQLRALEHGVRIRVCRTAVPAIEVNTPEDLERAEAMAS